MFIGFVVKILGACEEGEKIHHVMAGMRVDIHFLVVDRGIDRLAEKVAQVGYRH